MNRGVVDRMKKLNKMNLVTQVLVCTQVASGLNLRRGDHAAQETEEGDGTRRLIPESD